MRFKLYRQYGALNSQPIFDAFAQGARSLGHSIVDNHEDVAVIWSVLWSGRMSRNREVFYQCRNINKPVIIIEVGNLRRNHTWRISLNHINNLGEFANDRDLDSARSKKLGVDLRDRRSDQRPDILIACQHSHSLQWEGMPSMKTWVENTVKQIRAKSQRKIIVRPHPRSLFGLDNSGPAVQAAIQGVPVLCDSTSLASDLSITWDQIETPMMPDRQEWFLRLCHTEWTVEEISQGMPLARLMSKIS